MTSHHHCSVIAATNAATACDIASSHGPTQSRHR